jgi:hypothetical protein
MTAPISLAKPDAPALIVGELTYISYAHNRRTISAERLARLFGSAAPALEARYQQELREQPKVLA